MSEFDDGGPAFPEDKPWNSSGMTLWDYCAAAALQGMLAHSRNGHGYRPRDPGADWHKAIAEEAGEIADAMLAERRKRFEGDLK